MARTEHGRIGLLAAACVLVAGCSGGARTVAPAETADRPEAADSVQAESFDLTPYRDQPADVRTEVVHDVPAALLENRADVGIERTVEGFRVQVFSTLDQEEAAANEEAAREFWRSIVDAAEAGADLPEDLQVYRLFRQPYYRIRVGDFVDRSRAERVAVIFAERFGGAFVVPDQVTVRK